VGLVDKLIIFFFCACFILNCQADLSNEKEIVQGNSELKLSDGTLDLSQFSQEQQKIEREQAAKRREELKKGRVILQLDSEEKVVPGAINLAVFARTAKNKVREKVYNRNLFGSNDESTCEKFNNENDAQIFFLKNGGPKFDYYNIDQDGDGFACRWDPRIFRKINSLADTEQEPQE
jgi:hypothetical protein